VSLKIAAENGKLWSTTKITRFCVNEANFWGGPERDSRAIAGKLAGRRHCLVNKLLLQEKQMELIMMKQQQQQSQQQGQIICSPSASSDIMMPLRILVWNADGGSTKLPECCRNAL